ncbi:alpha/beta hydrolase [Acidianus manzaensis]|uniref:Carboxylesterase n=1 Tax=Acidianus manzaensis TaxID=282676 RepID=A0A1W6JZ92_9CREN|nr:alpha/beta hydrolase [Acidianus manzaensis]ARM75530.1 carboxylesterase [Acidianus manzaensis]
MPLDPKVREFLSYYYKNFQEIHSFQEFREKTNSLLANLAPKEKIYKTEDKTIKTEDGYNLPIRIYYPNDRKDLPIVLHFHGGAWILGNIETEDAISRVLANACNCIVISVDYRLAPEYKFPTAVNDCFTATKWAYENADNLGKRNIGVFGISAGGNLASVVALLSRDKGIKLSAQALVVPFVYPDLASKSMNEYSKGYFLDINVPVDNSISLYIRDQHDLLNPLLSPLTADNLSNLPPAIVVTAEYDPLRDQGEAYASRLIQSNVDTISIRINGEIHAFIGSPNVSRRVTLMVGAVLKDLLK